MTAEQHARILIVEDDEGVADLECRRLEAVGHSVIVARTAAQALDVAQNQSVDLAILDYRLEGTTTGLDLSEQFKAAGIDLPIIIVTGFSEESTIIRALRSGVRDFVAKSPSYLEYLPSAVQRVLAHVRLERKLAESEAKFRSVSESTSDAIIATDRAGNVISWNRAAEVTFGYAADEILGRSVSCLVPERYHAIQQSVAERVAREGEQTLLGQTIELAGLRKDGSEFPLELSVGAWRRGDELFLSGIVRDITDRKHAEEALRQREEQLRQAQKMESLGTLAGGVAHEFNNLLQSVLGYSHCIAESLEPSDPRQRDLQVIITAAERAATLTRQLLGFSRRQTLHFADLEPNQLVEEMVGMLRPLIGPHIQLELSLGADAGAVHADASQLQQMLMNLCLNARDAMPDGGELMISTAPCWLDDAAAAEFPELHAGRHLLITVRDTGSGMSEAVMQRAFEPFFTTKEVGKGTGLGLAMVYGVVSQHQGAVRVESKLGDGTVFRVLLPTVSTAAGGAAANVARHTPSHEATLLVVDDEPLVRELLVRTLTTAGYCVYAAEDGFKALQLFELHRHEIDLLLLDLMMPGLNGRQVFERICGLGHRVPTIVSSAYDLDSDGLSFVREQGLRFLQKPFKPAALRELVKDLLCEERGRLAPLVGQWGTGSPIGMPDSFSGR